MERMERSELKSKVLAALYYDKSQKDVDLLLKVDEYLDKCTDEQAQLLSDLVK